MAMIMGWTGEEGPLGLGWEEAEEGREWGWTLSLPLEFQS